MSDETPAAALARLRASLLELQRTGLMDPQSFGTHQQMILHIYQECERRALTCQSEAESYRAKAMAAEHQAGAFKMMASIIGVVVNAFVQKVEAGNREAAEREKERAQGQESAEPAPPSAPAAAPSAPPEGAVATSDGSAPPKPPSGGKKRR